MKIAIVGSAQPSREFAPYQDLEWLIFGLGISGWFMPRCDQIFELHPKETLDQYSAEQIALLHDAPRRQKANVIWLDKSAVATFPDAVAKEFPYKEIASQFRFPCFRSSVDWMMASAICVIKGERSKRNTGGTIKDDLPVTDTIALYGIKMESGSEYEYQRNSCELWIGYAAGLGIDVFLADGINLGMTPKMYGAEAKENAALKTFAHHRIDELNKEIDKWTKELSHSEACIKECVIRRDEMEWVLRNQTLADGGDVPI